jgi:hypothetical protein
LLSFANKCTGQKSYPKTNLEQFGLPQCKYPVKSGTDPIEKQKDYLEILDTYKKNYNAVIVQIRSVGDALSFKVSTMVEIFDWERRAST